MKKTIKIYFTDFWTGFEPESFYLYKLLEKHFNLEISKKPDLLIYSCFGNNFRDYNCHRLFFTAENRKSHFSECDFSITFEKLKTSKQYYLPYAFFRIMECGHQRLLEVRHSQTDAESIWHSKEGFCSMVVSNGSSKTRLNFFHKLSGFKTVDSGGRVENNIGGAVKDKLEFVKKYRFNFAFENASFPFYLTEKFFDAIHANSIPIYWGDPNINDVYNPKRFLNRLNFDSDEALIERIKELENDPEMAIKILQEPVLNPNFDKSLYSEKNLESFLINCIQKSTNSTPVAQSYKRFIRPLKNKLKVLLKK